MPKARNMQYGDCPKETVVASQADVSLLNEGAGAKETFQSLKFPSTEIKFVADKGVAASREEIAHR
jgi:hypothetical protein